MGVAVVAALPDLPGAEAQRSAEAEAQGSAGEGCAEVSEAVVLSVSPPGCGRRGRHRGPCRRRGPARSRTAELHSASSCALHCASSSDLETRTPGEPEDVEVVETPAESRHVVFTAGYRLTRKGPDRGKWSFELAATADAPLGHRRHGRARRVMHRSQGTSPNLER